MNIVGDLAESWDITAQGLVITFHLRKGVKWHDGQPFTAADVLYTYQVTVDPKTPTAYAEDFKAVKKAEVLDDYTFPGNLRQTFCSRFDQLGQLDFAPPFTCGKRYYQKSAGAPSYRHWALHFQEMGGRTENRSCFQSRLF